MAHDGHIDRETPAVMERRTDMKKKLLALLLAFALVCAALSACGGGSGNTGGGGTGDSAAESGEAASGGEADAAPEDHGVGSYASELFVGIAQDLGESLDPHKSEGAGSREVLFNVFEGLMKPTPDGDLVPAVAESYALSEDHLTYTFTIRPGITFHNGLPVTAQDVIFSINRRMGENIAEPDVIPVAAFDAIAELSAGDGPDGNTVIITLSEPSNEFLSYLTSAVLPSGYMEQDTAPVGTGPFRFVSRTAQDSIVLERYDDYWGEAAKMEKVTFRIVENTESILMSLQSGAVDLFAHLSATQALQLERDFQILESPMNLIQALYLNNAAAPFDNLLVRQALCYAVDKQQILDLAFDGYGFPIGSSMYPAFGKYFDESLTDYYPHDVEKAKALLADAGYPDGFSMTITVPSNYGLHVDTAQVIVEQLKEIGVQASIQTVTWGSWLNDVYSERNFESTVIGVDATNMTARALLERFSSDAPNNFINYNNAEYDRLFMEAQASYDDGEQTALYKQMERNLTENAANVYIQDMADLIAVRKGYTGFRFYPIYVLDLAAIEWTGET